MIEGRETKRKEGKGGEEMGARNKCCWMREGVRNIDTAVTQE